MVQKNICRSFLFVILLILVVLFPNEARSTVARNWKPIGNLKDVQVVMAGKFAVAEYNKQANKRLDFVAVVKGEQLIAGISMKYRLVISAKDGAAAGLKDYRALVWTRPSPKAHKFILKYFNEVSDKPLFAGGWKPIHNLENPFVVMIAKLAVMEHNKKTNKSLDYVTLVKAEQTVVSVALYRLVISAKNGGAASPKSYRAEVWLRAWRPGILSLILDSFKEIKG